MPMLAPPDLPVQTAQAPSHRFHRDHVLGTSFDMVVTGGDAALAETAFAAARSEIERLDAVLSGWREDSELARLNRAVGPFKASPDLFAVVARCEAWRTACAGAFSARIGGVEALWRKADQGDVPPDGPRLQRASLEAEAAPVRLDAETLTIDRAGVTFAVDALAKGYIIDSAFKAARAAGPGLGVMLDIGGDLRCDGPSPAPGGWRIGLGQAVDADNRTPAQAVTIATGAVATSGAGARDRLIGGCAVSHTLAPDSGQAVAATTVAVVASRAADADALATALGVMAPQQGLQLAVAHGAQARIVDADGAMHETPGWSGLLAPAVLSSPGALPPLIRTAGASWPRGFQVEIAYEIPQPTSGRARPPFVAVWITDEQGKLVRTLFHLGDHPGRYLDSNYVWFAALQAAGRGATLDTVTRPSRRAGQYTAVWDGKDDKGALVGQGRYTVNIEMSREHGGHSLQTMPMLLGAAPASAAAGPKEESGPASARYGQSTGQGGAV